MPYIKKDEVIAYEAGNDEVYHPDCKPESRGLKPMTKTEMEDYIAVCNDCGETID